jgi:hypothetical protein
MSQPNTTYRYRPEGLEQCCLTTLSLEMYRREDAGEEKYVEGQVIKCINCNSEMICDESLKDGRLRWRRNAKNNRGGIDG